MNIHLRTGESITTSSLFSCYHGPRSRSISKTQVAVKTNAGWNVCVLWFSHINFNIGVKCVFSNTPESSLKILSMEPVDISDWSCWSWKFSCALWQLCVSQLKTLVLTHRSCLSPTANCGLSSNRGLCRILVLFLRSKEKTLRSALTLLLCSAAVVPSCSPSLWKAESGHQSQKGRARQPPSTADASFRRILSKFLLNSSFCLLSSYFFLFNY